MAEDDALRERLVEAIAPRAHLGEDEVRVARHEVDSPRAEGVLILLAALAHHGDRAGDVPAVVERGERASLRDEVHVEGRARLVQQVGDGGGGDGVARADAREPVGLREGAEDGGIPALLHVAQGVRLLLGEVDVGLVEGDDDVVGHALHEGIELVLEHHRAQRVRRVRDEDEARLRRDGAQDGVEVMGPVRLVVHLHELRAEELAHDGVHGEAVARRDEFRLRVEAGVAEQLDDFAAAAAHRRLLEVDAEVLSEARAQGKGRAVRVDMHARRGLLHGGDGEGRRPQRILVRGELHDVLGLHPELARGFLDGFPGLVGHQLKHILIGVLGNAHRLRAL